MLPTTARNAESHAVRHVLMTADAVGGVWPYAVDLGAALVDRGVLVTLAVMGPAPSDAQRLEAERHGIALLERACRLEWMEDPWDDVARAGEWLLTLERTLRPDVVHLNGYAHAALSWRAPVLVVAHSCVGSWWRAVHGCAMPASWDRYRSEVTRGLGAARLVVAPTAAMLRGLQEEYGALANCRVIPNGRALPAAEGHHVKEPIVLAAGRLWDEAKNVGALCAVASELPWQVCVAGDARPPDGSTPAAIEHVQHLGRLQAGELASWFARAAIYALPARYEPFGLSVLEAALSGCALVLGDIPSLRENWAGAAVFVPPDDRRALAGALRGLIDDTKGRVALGEAAKARAREFTVARMADRYLDAYEQVAATATVSL